MFFHRRKKQNMSFFVRNFIFGVEDSLVSTVGLLSGIAVAGVTRREIFLTGVVLVFVEAFSMGVGSFLSEQSVEEYEKHKEVPAHQSMLGALIMFTSYICAGFIPILPYLALEVTRAIYLSIALSLLVLFLLGAISAKFFKIHIIRHGLEMLTVGGIAILVGIAVGIFIQKI